MRRILGEQDIVTGDEAFDAAIPSCSVIRSAAGLAGRGDPAPGEGLLVPRGTSPLASVRCRRDARGALSRRPARDARRADHGIALRHAGARHTSGGHGRAREESLAENAERPARERAPAEPDALVARPYRPSGDAGRCPRGPFGCGRGGPADGCSGVRSAGARHAALDRAGSGRQRRGVARAIAALGDALAGADAERILASAVGLRWAGSGDRRVAPGARASRRDACRLDRRAGERTRSAAQRRCGRWARPGPSGRCPLS